MRCPTLTELPPPPPGKTGWPWTEETPQLPETMPDGSPWPRISIVTPSYNQGQFIEETIRSVLLQGYPNLEYIIIDGGSTDGSVEIIKKYEPWLAYWVSEKDKSQADAINKGWKIVNGGLFGWLNSDDLYAKECLGRVGYLFLTEADYQVFVGACGYINQSGKPYSTVKRKVDFDFLDYIYRWRGLPQPSCFWHTNLAIEVGGYLRDDLHFAFDWELFLRFWFANKKFYFDPEHIYGIERWHPGQKSRVLDKLSLELSYVGNCYFDKFMGGRWLNYFKMVWHNRKIAAKRGGLRNGISSFPTRQEKYYLQIMFKRS